MFQNHSRQGLQPTAMIKNSFFSQPTFLFITHKKSILVWCLYWVVDSDDCCVVVVPI